MPCVADCLATYSCGAPKRPFSGSVFAPYVKITFASANLNNGATSNNVGSVTTVGQTTVTSGDVAPLSVGNQSNPASGNHACIKSFQYGGSNGQGCSVEIYDEQGSEFSRFMENLNQTLDQAAQDYKMLVDFGWIIRKCTPESRGPNQGDGTIVRNWVSDNGGRLTFLPMKVIATYENGMIRFTIEATDMLSRVSENRADVPVGADGQPVRLTQAIRTVFSRTQPQINNVEFLRQTPQGPVPFGFKNSDGGFDGPLSTWPANQQNVLSASRMWLTSLTSDRNKGIHPTWDCGNPQNQPSVIFWEDATPGCGENANGCALSMGTYIVNGGDCSPVISFNPKVEYNFWANANSGGNLGGAMSQRPVRMRTNPLETCREIRNNRPVTTRTGGVQTQFPASQNDMGWRPPELVVPRMQQAVSAHQATASRYEHMGAIECELKIQGDPRFVHPKLWMDHTVAVIVINPFYITATSTNCGDWLAQPPCNSIYSQKEYRIMEVSHEIQEGSYTTTLKLRKDAPNIPSGPI